jgi:hypothetical protein
LGIPDFDMPYIQTMLRRERKSVAIDITTLKSILEKEVKKEQSYADKQAFRRLMDKYPFRFADERSELQKIKVTLRLAEEAKREMNNMIRKYEDPRSYDRFRT